MEFQIKELLKEHREAISQIKSVLDEGSFYLAGGTALYYILKHRNSIDLDFFTSENIDLRKFNDYFKAHELKLISKDTIHAVVKGVNLSLFLFPYPLLKPLIEFHIIKIASLEDILCMKVNAVIRRGSKKDFIDIYFIMKEMKLNSNILLELFQRKFGKYNPLIIKKALTYFEDAEKEPEIELIKKANWEDIKKFFIKEFGRI